jgi:phosphoglycerate dehydrogenase-like enzyme
MNRRTFISATAAAATLASASTSHAKPPKRVKVLIPATDAEPLSDLHAAAPDAELVQCRSEDEAVAEVMDADACYGFLSPRVIRTGKSLRWIQQPSAGVEHLIEIPELLQRDVVLTNMQRAYAPEIADQAIGYLLAFTRDLGHFIRAGADRRWGTKRAGFVLEELGGKTLLVIGLGGIGSEIARRAYGFGMRVLATDPKVHERPLFVEEMHRPERFHDLLPRADVVVSAAPLTKASRKMIGAREFGMMKQGVILINVSRGGVVDTDALVAALDSKRVSAAGLDVTDPEPLPEGHALWTRNVIITPHTAGQSPGGERRRHEIFRENLRRFAAGELLLNVVDKKVGY